MTQDVHAREAIVEWLLDRLARELGVPRASIAVDAPFEEYGLDSVQAVTIAGELGARLERELSDALLYDYATVAKVADHLAGARTASRAAAAAGGRSGAATARPNPSDDAIAVVGLACRFPGARGPDELWSLLSDGRHAIDELPRGRFGAGQEEYLDAHARTTAPRYGGFLDDVADFDAAFFRIAPREAVAMDPQQRMLLEVCHEAFDDAFEPPARLADTTAGVFVGTSTNDYAHLLLRLGELPEGYVATGTAASAAAGRVSYALDLRGPAIAVDAACASSLYAVHLACQHLRAGECSIALAAGANAMLIPEPSLMLDRLGMLAPDGRCKAFDARGDGYVRGEGAGAVVLKPLEDAYRDGNPVYCVIRGSAVNSNGRTNGLTAPSGPAQRRVVSAALERAGVRGSDVSYVEMQGTGTRLGDAIEAQALSAVLGQGRSVGRRCAIGSIKTNIGHLEAAAGVASLIKAALSVTHRRLPPSLNYEIPNPALASRTCALRVQDRADDWPRGRALAGVSAFGFSGTNVHAIVEEAPDGLAPVSSS